MQMISNTRMFQARRRPTQLSGWLEDVVQIAGTQGKTALNNAVASKSQAIGGDHIQQQNWTIDQFRQILDAVQAGRMDATRAAQVIESLTVQFAQFAAAYGPRGFRGANDVRNLATQIKQSLSGPLNLYGGTGATGMTGIVSTLQSNLPLVLLALGGMYLLSRGSFRRRTA